VLLLRNSWGERVVRAPHFSTLFFATVGNADGAQMHITADRRKPRTLCAANKHTYHKQQTSIYVAFRHHQWSGWAV
jgi:hypothetical protein